MSEATEATTKVKKERTPAQIEALSRARQLANQKRKENAELRLKEREIKKAELESRRTQIEKDYETKVKNKQAEVVEIEDPAEQESEPEPEQQIIQKVKKVKSKKKKKQPVVVLVEESFSSSESDDEPVVVRVPRRSKTKKPVAPPTREPVSHFVPKQQQEPTPQEKAHLDFMKKYNDNFNRPLW